jgi:hypothetical protein
MLQMWDCEFPNAELEKQGSGKKARAVKKLFQSVKPGRMIYRARVTEKD